MKIIFTSNNQADNKDIYEIHISKELLMESSNFFKKMLTNYREQYENTITLQVDNPGIAYDIINEILGTKSNILSLDKYVHYLLCIKMKFYLMIKYDNNILLDLKINPQYYDLLIDVVSFYITTDDATGVATDDAIGVLANNLPLNCKNLFTSKYVADKINRAFNNSITIIGLQSGKFLFVNANSGKIVKTICPLIGVIRGSYFIFDKSLLVIAYINAIHLWNVDKNICIAKIDTLYKINSIHYIPNSNQIIIENEDKTVLLYDLPLLKFSKYLITKHMVAVENKRMYNCKIEYISSKNAIVFYESSNYINIYYLDTKTWFWFRDTFDLLNIAASIYIPEKNKIVFIASETIYNRKKKIIIYDMQIKQSIELKINSLVDIFLEYIATDNHIIYQDGEDGIIVRDLNLNNVIGHPLSGKKFNLGKLKYITENKILIVNNENKYDFLDLQIYNEKCKLITTIENFRYQSYYKNDKIDRLKNIVNINNN